MITAKKMTYGVYQISSGETISARSAAEFVAAELEGVKVVEDTGRERMEPVLSNQRLSLIHILLFLVSKTGIVCYNKRIISLRRHLTWVRIAKHLK